MKTIHVGLLVGALVVGVWFWRGRSQGKPMKFVSTEEKRRNMGIIESLFIAKGHHPLTAKAAIVNAAAESNLSAGATASEPNGSTSVGLFQVNDLKGKRDLSAYNLADPASNTRWILDNERAGLDKIDAMADAGADVPALAAAFCTLIERPANPAKRAAERAALARQMFPPSEVS